MPFLAWNASSPELLVPLAEVVKSAQAGDRLAFDTLFQLYNTRICTYLSRMVGNDEDGRDLAQETFLKVWRALPQLQDEARFETWLYAIATRVAIDYIRRRKFRWPLWNMRDADTDLPESLITEGPEGAVEHAEQVKLALAQVSPRYRACLLLQLVAGFSQREIAQSLNMSEKSVSVYVSRGSEQFRQAYERLEQDHTAHSPAIEERNTVDEQ
jgi:RNA polymerase sigma-70 factor, ECF subfamily